MFVYCSVDSFVGIDRFLEFQREPAGRYLQVSVSAGGCIYRVFDTSAFKRAQVNRCSGDDGGSDQRSNKSADKESSLTRDPA